MIVIIIGIITSNNHDDNKKLLPQKGYAVTFSYVNAVKFLPRNKKEGTDFPRVKLDRFMLRNFPSEKQRRKT